MSNMNAALFAAKQGWKVVPAKVWKNSDGKKSVDFYVKWGTGSTDDFDVVRDWWVQWPDAVVGILTKANDLLVIDLDCHGGGQDGEAEWLRIVGEHGGGEIPQTFTVRTPTGGLHLYFTNTDQRLKNSASKLADGVDVRGAGGMAGGIIFYGARFDGEYVVEDDSPAAPLPEWLHDLLLVTVPTKGRTRDAWALPNPDRKFTVEQAQKFTYDYGLNRLAEAGQGERNNALNNAAICLGHFGPDFWANDVALNKLREVGRSIGLEPNEIEATIQSGYYDAEWLATLVTPEQAKDDELQRRLTEERLRRLVKKTIDQEEFAARTSIEDMLITNEALDDMPGVEYLIQGFLYRSSVALLYGRRNVGKTFVGLDMALSIATGLPWAKDIDGWLVGDGQDMAGFDTRKGKVLWIAGEGVRGIQGRVRAWELERGFTRPVADFVMVGGSLELASEARAEELAAIVKRDGYDLVVVDTLARNSAGLEENSASDMKTFYANVDTIKNANEGTCVLIVHHQGKGESKESRGSTVIEDAPESVFALSGDAQTMFFETTKQRDVAKAPRLVFHLEARPASNSAVVLRGRGESEPVAGEERSEVDQTRDIFLTNFDQIGCTTTDWIKAVREKFEVSEATARRRINDAVNGWDVIEVVEGGNGKATRYKVA